MTDRELLEKVFRFLAKRNYVALDDASIVDMVTRYQNPPLTRLHRICMQMTVNDYKELETLLEQIKEQFNPDRLAKERIENESQPA